MLKITTLCCVAIALAAPSVCAADQPSGRVPVLAAPPAFTWTGFYVGVDVGADFNERATTVSTPVGFITQAALSANGNLRAADFALASNATLSNSRTPFLGGGQIGYNRQFNQFVAGLEVDFQGFTNSGGSNTTINSAMIAAESPVQSTVTTTKRVDYLGTVRGRLGYLVTSSLLAFATGGFAYGHIASATVVNAQETVFSGLFPTGSIASFNTTKTGYTVGGGLEYKLTANISIKGEYLFYDLGRITYASPPLIGTLDGTSPVFGHTPSTTTRFSGSVARFGLNYAFTVPALPVVARY